MRLGKSAGVFLLAAGCAGGAAPGPLDDGATLSAPLEIPAGMTVTIPPGARLVAAPGVTITVRGVLVVASASRHARIGATTAMPDTSHAWGGLVVASGGRLDADGLDLAGAATALTLAEGSAGARYDDGTISDGGIPFQIHAGARLDTAHAAVVGATGASGIEGELHASHLDYASSSLGGGLVTMDPAAVLDATDSTFHGTALGADFITSYAASLIHLAYSTVSDAHCAFHFDDITRFEIDHVTTGSPDPSMTDAPLVVYGAMLYGAGAGPNTVSDSNFLGGAYGLDEQNAQGPLTVTNTFTRGNDANDGASPWTWAAADVAKAPILDAKPR